MTVLTGATRTPRSGQYVIDGVKYPRVTSILGIISKPGLVAWKLRVGVAEAARVSQAAASLGTAIHAACEWLDADADGDVDLALVPYLAAYERWRDAHVVDVLAAEQMVHHPTRLYAGTLDRLFRLHDGRTVVGDIKTGKSVDATARLQTMAYQEALEAHGYQIDGRVILHLPSSRPGELRPIDYDDEDEDRQAWHAALRLWQWNRKHRNDYKETRMDALDIIPRTNRATIDLLTDLARRAERAMAYAEEAAAAGDEARMKKATMRYFWRMAQLAFLRQRDPEATCPECEQGDDWQVDPTCWEDGGQMLCLDHADAWIREEQATQYSLWRAGQ